MQSTIFLLSINVHKKVGHNLYWKSRLGPSMEVTELGWCSVQPGKSAIQSLLGYEASWVTVGCLTYLTRLLWVQQDGRNKSFVSSLGICFGIEKIEYKSLKWNRSTSCFYPCLVPCVWPLLMVMVNISEKVATFFQVLQFKSNYAVKIPMVEICKHDYFFKIVMFYVKSPHDCCIVGCAYMFQSAVQLPACPDPLNFNGPQSSLLHFLTESTQFTRVLKVSLSPKLPSFTSDADSLSVTSCLS